MRIKPVHKFVEEDLHEQGVGKYPRKQGTLAISLGDPTPVVGEKIDWDADGIIVSGRVLEIRRGKSRTTLLLGEIQAERPMNSLKEFIGVSVQSRRKQGDFVQLPKGSVRPGERFRVKDYIVTANTVIGEYVTLREKEFAPRCGCGATLPKTGGCPYCRAEMVQLVGEEIRREPSLTPPTMGRNSR